MSFSEDQAEGIPEKSVKTFTHRMPGSLEICLPTLDFLSSCLFPAIHLRRIQPSSPLLPTLVRGEGAQTYRHWQARQQTKEKLRCRLPANRWAPGQWGGWRYPRLSAHSALYPTALLVLYVPALQRFAQQRVPCSLYRASSSFKDRASDRRCESATYWLCRRGDYLHLLFLIYKVG